MGPRSALCLESRGNASPRIEHHRRCRLCSSSGFNAAAPAGAAPAAWQAARRRRSAARRAQQPVSPLAPQGRCRWQLRPPLAAPAATGSSCRPWQLLPPLAAPAAPGSSCRPWQLLLPLAACCRSRRRCSGFQPIRSRNQASAGCAHPTRAHTAIRAPMQLHSAQQTAADAPALPSLRQWPHHRCGRQLSRWPAKARRPYAPPQQAQSGCLNPPWAVLALLPTGRKRSPPRRQAGATTRAGGELPLQAPARDQPGPDINCDHCWLECLRPRPHQKQRRTRLRSAPLPPSHLYRASLEPRQRDAPDAWWAPAPLAGPPPAAAPRPSEGAPQAASHGR
jgi:hypothetical protein